MDKKKLQAAIAPFPIKQSDKERFVNTITEMSSSGGGGVEYEYYKFDENFRDFDTSNPDTQDLLFTIFLHSYKIISIIKQSENSNVNVLLETSPFLNTVMAGLDRYLRSFYFYFKVIKEDIKYTRVYEDEGDSKLTAIGEININITGADFIEKIAKIYLIQSGSSEFIPEDVIQQSMEIFKQMLIPITKEEYESLIGQEVTA